MEVKFEFVIVKLVRKAKMAPPYEPTLLTNEQLLTLKCPTSSTLTPPAAMRAELFKNLESTNVAFDDSSVTAPPTTFSNAQRVHARAELFNQTPPKRPDAAPTTATSARARRLSTATTPSPPPAMRTLRKEMALRTEALMATEPLGTRRVRAEMERTTSGASTEMTPRADVTTETRLDAPTMETTAFGVVSRMGEERVAAAVTLTTTTEGHGDWAQDATARSNAMGGTDGTVT